MKTRTFTHNVQGETERIREIPLFSRLRHDELEGLSRGLVYVEEKQGHCLFQQGADADSAFFLLSGELDIVSALPGGGETHLATLLPGNTLGETALVSAGIRSASVRARTDISGFTMSRHFFQGAIAQGDGTAARILAQLLCTTSERLRTQYEHLAANTDIQHGACCHTCGESVDPGKTRAPCSFPLPEFLPQLDFFSGFSKEETDALTYHVPGFELPRSTTLFRKGESPYSCYFVVRGALQLAAPTPEGHRPLAILGPGSFLGSTDCIAGVQRLGCGSVREEAALLEFSAPIFQQWLHDRSRLGIKFQLALCRSLVTDLGTLNKRVARMASCEAVNVH